MIKMRSLLARYIDEREEKNIKKRTVAFHILKSLSY
jgi:hypothetical protein